MILVLLIFILVLFHKMKVFQTIQRFNSIRQLPKFPAPFSYLLGHLMSLPNDSSSMFRFMEKNVILAAGHFKQKIAVLWVGLSPEIFLLHPDAAEIFLKTSKHLKKGKKYKLIEPWLKDGLVLSSGRKWYDRRKMITPTFHHDILKTFSNAINKHSSNFINEVISEISNDKDQKFDVRQKIKLCTLKIISETAMGCVAETENSLNYFEAIHKISTYIHHRIYNPIYQYEWIFNLSSLGREQKKTLKFIDDFTKTVVEKRLKKKLQLNDSRNHIKQKRKAFLDLLIDSSGSNLSSEDIEEEVTTFIVAGYETTATAISWTIYLLGLYPSKQQKLLDEIDKVFNGHKTCDITDDHLKEMPYLDLVIKEVLRLYPPGAFIGRETEENCVVDGMEIPRGSNITISIYAIHRHPDLWDEPNKFIPERFDVENRLKRNLSPFSYIPFSAGPRNCIGQRFALQEMKIILTNFFRNFSVVSLVPENLLEIKSTLTLEIKGLMNVKVNIR